MKSLVYKSFELQFFCNLVNKLIPKTFDIDYALLTKPRDPIELFSTARYIIKKNLVLINPNSLVFKL